MVRRLLIVSCVVFSSFAVLVACGGGDDTIENAEVLIDLGKYDKALDVLEAASTKDPKNVNVYLLKGRAFLDMGELENADDAFGDAVAVGGKSAARMVDDTVIEQYQKSFERLYLSDNQSQRGPLRAVFRSLALLNSEDSKIATMSWTLDFLLDQKDPDISMYREVSEFFGDDLDIDHESVEDVFLSAIERLLKQTDKGDQYSRAAGNLAAQVTSDEGQANISKIVNKYVPADIVQAGQARRTMSDMRTLAVCMEAFAVDNARYPVAANFDLIRPFIQPTYVKTAPTTDGWGTEFKVVSKPNIYIIVSAGSDRTFDESYTDVSIPSPGGAMEGFEHDIIYSAGSFVQYPEKVAVE